MARDVEEGPARSAAVRRLDSLAWLLDDSIPIPGTGRRVGVDAVIGLVPGVGDAAGALLSGYIVVRAAALGAPFAVLMRMVLNVGIEGIVGSIPLLGDLFDAAWKANDRNVRLLHQVVDAPGAAHRSSKAFVLGIMLLVLLVLAGTTAFAVWVVWMAVRQVGW